MTLRKKVLAAFDVDNTINTYFLESLFFSKINASVRNKYMEGRKPWEERVSNAMSMHQYSLSDATEYVKGIGMVPGMKTTLENLKARDVDIIVLSGGSDLLVKLYLEHHGVSHYFKDIIANRLQESAGMLMYRPVPKVSPCLPQCKGYLCKHFYLTQYNKGRNYEQVYMVGDG